MVIILNLKFLLNQEHQLNKQNSDLYSLQKVNDDLKDEVTSLNSSNENLKNTIQRLNTEVSDTKSKHEQETNERDMEWKENIKNVKAKMDNERKEKIKLEEKYKDLADELKEKKKSESKANQTNLMDPSPFKNVSSQTSPYNLFHCDDCSFVISDRNEFEAHMKAKHSRKFLDGKFKKVTTTKDLVIREWSDETSEGHDIIMAYVNMQNYARHKCEDCMDVFVRNTSKGKNPTWGWDLRFCTRYNFKLGDKWKEPPYMKSD